MPRSDLLFKVTWPILQWNCFESRWACKTEKSQRITGTLRLPLVVNSVIVMFLLSSGRTRRKRFLIPEHLNNYEIQYLWFPSVAYMYLNVNVCHYYLFKVSPLLFPLPPPRSFPSVSPSYSSAFWLHPPVLSCSQSPHASDNQNTIFTFRIVMINKNRVWIPKGTKSYDVIQRVKLYIGNRVMISEWGIHRH